MGFAIQNTVCIRAVRFMMLAFFTLFTLHASGQVIVWEAEAENGILSGTADIKADCTNASGGLFVRMYAEAGNQLLFNNVVAERTGIHLLVIHYFYVGSSTLEVVVNGIPAGRIEFPSAQWCYQGSPASVSVNIPLNQGTNEIAFRTTGGQVGPFIDRVQLIDEEAIRVGRSYYVSASDGNDSNSGTGPGEPWKSFEKVNYSHFIPGDTILFRAGSEYSGQLIINSSGAPGSPIVYSSYGSGEKPVINGAIAPGGAYSCAVFINNHSFIEINGLEITNDRRISRSGVDNKIAYGIFVLNDGDSIMDHFHFRNLSIREVYAISTEGVEFNDLKVAGIYFRSERNQVAGKEKHIRNVLVDSCFISRTGKFGIWSQHAGGDNGIGNDSLNRNMNLVFRYNHTFETGGSGITPGGSYNCLVEHNTFEYTGSNADPRMAQRGSGAWFFNCRNVIAQYNTSLHVRGKGDSYGMHIDYGNRDVILQYNYSEDSEGGFVEILGKNINSVYRFNVSVNDGIRDNKGNSVWISTYAGDNNQVPSDSNFIYNNTIYVDGPITPDIYIEGKNTFLCNNIFFTGGSAVIGQGTDIITTAGGIFQMSNNLFQGNVNSTFSAYDQAPVFGNPLFEDPGEGLARGFILQDGSPALQSAKLFDEPEFHMAGKGIFKDIPSVPKEDMFGNPVNLQHTSNIGAYNGIPWATGFTDGQILRDEISIVPNPATDHLVVVFKSDLTRLARIGLTDLSGRVLYNTGRLALPGENRMRIQLPETLSPGIYMLYIQKDGYQSGKSFLVKEKE